MPHIIWCGNKKWDSKFPEKPLPENAVKIERKGNIFTGCLFYGIIPFLFCLFIIYIKWHWLGTKTVYPALVPAGILIGLLLMPVLLGIIPLAVFLGGPSSPVLSAICIPTGIVGMLSPMPDYMDVHMVYKQVPKEAYIQSQNDGIYWFK